jgi:hypothetical protein
MNFPNGLTMDVFCHNAATVGTNENWIVQGLERQQTPAITVPSRKKLKNARSKKAKEIKNPYNVSYFRFPRSRLKPTVASHDIENSLGANKHKLD